MIAVCNISKVFCHDIMRVPNVLLISIHTCCQGKEGVACKYWAFAALQRSAPVLAVNWSGWRANCSALASRWRRRAAGLAPVRAAAKAPPPLVGKSPAAGVAAAVFDSRWGWLVTVETCTGYLTEFGWCGGGQLGRRQTRLAERRTVSESRFRTPCSDGWFATQSRNLGLASAKKQ